MKHWLGKVYRRQLHCLEIKRTSITRLKPFRRAAEWDRNYCLEIKRTSITRLKLDYSEAYDLLYKRVLEIKRTSITRLKRHSTGNRCWHACPWNQKNLDYEIETGENRVDDLLRIASWNQKNLDYEIETVLTFSASTSLGSAGLEIKRTSITRLKQECVPNSWHRAIGCLKSKEPRLRDWNKRPHASVHAHPVSLKSKEPRLRDWNSISQKALLKHHVFLKSKEPRLRDWNLPIVFSFDTCFQLEIKRTSITRLKLGQQCCPRGLVF